MICLFFTDYAKTNNFHTVIYFEFFSQIFFLIFFIIRKVITNQRKIKIMICLFFTDYAKINNFHTMVFFYEKETLEESNDHSLIKLR